MSQDDYRQLLKAELARRTARNRAYSLRRFAAQLGVSVAFASEVLSGRKRLTVATAHRIAARIGWADGDANLFVALVRQEQAPDEAAAAEVARSRRNARVKFRRVDDRRARSEQLRWYHYALFELVDLPDFVAEPAWIARKLGLLEDEAADAVRYLVRAGMLAWRGDTLVKPSRYVVLKTPRQVTCRFHRDLLDRAKAAVTEQCERTGEYASITMAFAPAKLPQAVEIIRRFQAEMSALSEGEPPEAVYHLGIQFFRLDR